ncbi:hypothetical protein GUJ93_ZPchr0013g34338 [Zizania palustris]|uniref:Uncharacterized protein n=1 Tax=Zizania palustris TaxID=103762 RepID=A0A8J5WQX8_ZIZPA|nr:hypothetical protein GUJ93_ZPchr0013g34338 [Zizania palustris]
MRSGSPDFPLLGLKACSVWTASYLGRVCHEPIYVFFRRRLGSGSATLFFHMRSLSQLPAADGCALPAALAGHPRPLRHSIHPELWEHRHRAGWRWKDGKAVLSFLALSAVSTSGALGANELTKSCLWNCRAEGGCGIQGGIMSNTFLIS